MIVAVEKQEYAEKNGLQIILGYQFHSVIVGTVVEKVYLTIESSFNDVEGPKKPQPKQTSELMIKTDVTPN